MRVSSCWLFLAGVLVLANPLAGSGADAFKPEPGFTFLFNGKDLSGWKMKKSGDSLDGKTEAAGGRFKMVDGVLVIDPKVKGDLVIETVKPLRKGVHIKFDFKPGKGCNNDLFILGVKFDLKKPDVKNLKEDEWNSFEIISQDGKVEYKNNGETLKTSGSKVEMSPLGIRAEFGPIQIRRLRAKEMP